MASSCNIGKSKLHMGKHVLSHGLIGKQETSSPLTLRKEVVVCKKIKISNY